MKGTMSFGRFLAQKRKEAGLSQKDLAARIKKEDGSPISPQYLNDVERDRRNPPSEHFIKQLASELGVPDDYLYFLASQYPDDLRDEPHRYDSHRVQAAFQAFRRELKKD
jgi:transcriptional regulator with XRE-family HTH domain